MNYRKVPYSTRRIWSYVNNNFMTALGIEGKEEPKFSNLYQVSVKRIQGPFTSRIRRSYAMISFRTPVLSP